MSKYLRLYVHNLDVGDVTSCIALHLIVYRYKKQNRRGEVVNGSSALS
jgi:hypothetical protein